MECFEPSNTKIDRQQGTVARKGNNLAELHCLRKKLGVAARGMHLGLSL